MELNNTAEAVVTALANIVGYAAAVLIVVHFVRRAGGSFVVGFPQAAFALFVLWCAALGFYVGTEYWIASEGERAPAWMESTNGIAENVQSEILQIWIAAFLFSKLRWPGSPESK